MPTKRAMKTSFGKYNGTFCPHCGGKDLSKERPYNDYSLSMDVHRRIHCENCGKKWEEHFEVSSFISITNKD